MKTIFFLVLCALFSLNIFGQSSEEPLSDAAVEEISLARDDGNGNAGELADRFTTADIPLHCLINLTSTKPVAVKMNLVAVAANGYKPESVVISVSYKTNGKQNRVKFQVSPDKIWAAGKYRIDVLIDGKASGSKAFEIQKSGKETESEKPAPPKPKSKPGRKSKSG